MIEETDTRESMEFDVVIVGAGPAGLSAAIRLKQLNPALSVIVLEKGVEVGAHILSGAVVDPAGIDALLPGWREEAGHPFRTAVTRDRFMVLTPRRAFGIPAVLLPRILSNHGSFVVSLGHVCRWLAQKAEALGVEVYPGFAGVRLLYNRAGAVTGVVTGDMGVRKDGSRGPGFVPGMALTGKYLLIAEGARGSLAKTVIARHALDRGRSPQKFGIGLKELWEVDTARHQAGLVQHFFGWPLDNRTGGGAFLYHLDDNRVAVGAVVHLDYRNPYLSPFEELQRFKTHPAVCGVFRGARRIAYGARAISEGGFQSVPKLVFPGGALIGCAAGFVNVPRIKGVHNAVLSGMATAKHVAAAIAAGRAGDEITEIEESWRSGAIGRDLFPVRNVKPLWARYGTRCGVMLGGMDMWCQQLAGLSLFGTLRHDTTDAAALEPADRHKPIDYPAHDNVLTFDRLSSVYLSNTRHDEDEPCHLHVKDKNLQLLSELAVYGGPSGLYCPAAVYEWVGEEHDRRYVINAQNCVHCKVCDIKDPNQNIDWTPPQGGEGPVYMDM